MNSPRSPRSFRRRSGYLALLALALGLLLLCRAARADNTFPGNVSVAGSVDVQGPTLSLGTQGDNANNFGVLWSYQEDASHQATLALKATRPSPVWLWQKAYTSAGAASQMRLDGGNALTLFDQATPTPNPAIVLDPVSGSTFQASVTMNGPNNQMPNQQVTGSASVLTVGLADARYATFVSGGSTSLGLNAVVGPTATAVGYAANAGGQASTAVGFQAVATGGSAVAVGNGATATGVDALALGTGSHVAGNNAAALGYGAQADGEDGLAIGLFARASVLQAAAYGLYSTASGVASAAFGGFSQANGVTATSLGWSSVANGGSSVTLGAYSQTNGELAMALGSYSVVNANNAVSLGEGSGVSGYAAMSLGYHSAASASGAVAVGSYAAASGLNATALSSSSVASGDYAVAAGSTAATSLYECTVGAFGTSGGDAHQWVPTDALFTVANGQSAQAPSNALVVQKNGNATFGGNATFKGVVTVMPGGDIPMYTPPSQ